MSQLRRKIDNRPIPKSAAASQPVRSGDLNKVINVVNEISSETEDNTNRIAVLEAEVSEIKPYTIYTLLLTQSSTNDPSVITLENTTGKTLTATRDSTGVYSLKFNTTIDINKTFIYNSADSLDGVNLNRVKCAVSYDGSKHYIKVSTYNNSLTLADGILSLTSIEIKLFP